MQAYLKTDPKFAYMFKHVWLWEEFPAESDLGGIDMGIDLVALTHEGDYWAIQCKCYQETTLIEKGEVDSFGYFNSEPQMEPAPVFLQRRLSFREADQFCQDEKGYKTDCC